MHTQKEKVERNKYIHAVYKYMDVYAQLCKQPFTYKNAIYAHTHFNMHKWAGTWTFSSAS